MTDGPWTIRDLNKTLVVRPGVDDQYEVDDGRTKKNYEIGVTTIYVGEAALGAADADPVWTIRRITLVDGNPTTSEWTAHRSATWDDRATETYS